MRILIAPDSFKNALRNTEVAAALAEGWLSIRPQDEVLCFPLSDGGEGFCTTLMASNPEWVREEFAAHDALMRPLKCHALLSKDGMSGALELAAASGLELIPRSELQPMAANTYGTGELLLHLVQRGCRKIWMGIGGSATTDGGAGALMALGAKFYNREGAEMHSPAGGGQLMQIARVDVSPVRKLLEDIEVTVACDVSNPLCGVRGSAAVFAPQKGASSEQVKELDANLKYWAGLFGSDGNFPGAGAAGGMGFMMVQAGARLVPGARALIGGSGLAAALEQGADLLITGEGKSDSQTLDGKLCAEVAQNAAARNVPAALLSGAVPVADRPVLKKLFREIVAISENEPSLEQALANTRRNLVRCAAALAARQ